MVLLAIGFRFPFFIKQPAIYLCHLLNGKFFLCHFFEQPISLLIRDWLPFLHREVSRYGPSHPNLVLNDFLCKFLTVLHVSAAPQPTDLTSVRLGRAES